MTRKKCYTPTPGVSGPVHGTIPSHSVKLHIFIGLKNLKSESASSSKCSRFGKDVISASKEFRIWQNRFWTRTQKGRSSIWGRGDRVRNWGQRDMVVLRTWTRIPVAEKLSDRKEAQILQACELLKMLGLYPEGQHSQGRILNLWAARFMFFKITLTALLKHEEGKKDGREKRIVLSFT